MNRKRKIQKIFCVDEKENELIKRKKSTCRNFKISKSIRRRN